MNDNDPNFECHQPWLSHFINTCFLGATCVRGVNTHRGKKKIRYSKICQYLFPSNNSYQNVLLYSKFYYFIFNIIHKYIFLI